MNKPKCFFVISRYLEDVSWINDFNTDDYLIFDKGHTLEKDIHIMQLDDVGYNIFDMMALCYYNYNNLPDLIAFVQGFPWDHCKRETFDKLIYNTNFTPLEDYSHIPESDVHKKDIDGGYLEINTSWYLYNEDPKFSHKYYWTFDQFMEDTFENYIPLDWIRFAPGAQYIVPKENILYYSKEFYQKLMGTVGYSELPLEAYLLERAMYYIFTNKYLERPIKKYEKI